MSKQSKLQPPVRPLRRWCCRDFRGKALQAALICLSTLPKGLTANGCWLTCDGVTACDAVPSVLAGQAAGIREWSQFSFPRRSREVKSSAPRLFPQLLSDPPNGFNHHVGLVVWNVMPTLFGHDELTFWKPPYPLLGLVFHVFDSSLL